jgi:hypothetical protein
MTRSQSWKNLLDPETKNMRPRKNGGWDKPFDPREVNNNYTEGNSWHYTFFVPQDIPGMIEAFGGKEVFEAKLDEMFNAPSSTTGREQVDVTGLMGQYAQGNEPSHHMAYLYNYVGKPEKANEKVHYILNEFYKNSPDGLIGNEDCGQMSAWYVLSSMGMYTVTPGEPGWDTVTPVFNRIKLHLEDGTNPIITPETPQRWLLDVTSEELDDDFLEDIIPVPAIEAESKSFEDKMKINFTSLRTDVEFFYRVSDIDNKKDDKFILYSKPFTITKSSIVEVYSVTGLDGEKSKTVTATFIKKPNNYTIKLNSRYNSSYSAGGATGLIDGILGSENWRKGDWQGYQSQDFEAVIDLQKNMKVSEISARFLQDSRSWILMPVKVEYYVSEDNIYFTLAQTIDNTINPKDDGSILKSFDAKLNKTKARYIKVKAYNFGKLPQWHQGYGGDAFIFIDEITVK